MGNKCVINSVIDEAISNVRKGGVEWDMEEVIGGLERLRHELSKKTKSKLVTMNKTALYPDTYDEAIMELTGQEVKQPYILVPCMTDDHKGCENKTNSCECTCHKCNKRAPFERSRK